MKIKSIFISLIATSCISPVLANDLTVITAAGYRKPLSEVFDAFTKETGIQVNSAYGHIKQIEIQAKQNPDIQIAFGDWYFIEPMGIADREQQIGQGKLVLAVPKNQQITAIQDLLQNNYQKIALGNPKSTIYGKAAQECLTYYGLADQVFNKTLEVSTLPQVSAYLITNEVDAGFINQSEALAHSHQLGNTYELPQECYRPITLSAVSLSGRDHTPSAQALMAFMNSETATAILKRHGL